jgi:hypothetical protein
MGCDAIEDAHHIFVHCRRYNEWRTIAAVELQNQARAKLTEKGFEEAECIGLRFAGRTRMKSEIKVPASTSALGQGGYNLHNHFVDTSRTPLDIS